MKIAVGMSGGVDSSVTAAQLIEEGHEVVGLTMKMSTEIIDKGFFCAGEESIKDAGEVARSLDIPLYEVDISQEFEAKVISYLKEEYLQGSTPNPCVMCNRLVKFGAFLDQARKMNIAFDKVATGHYARIELDEEKNRYLLRKAIYLKKDQSYFLAQLKQEQLAMVLFPLGSIENKEKVREIAAGLSLPVHAKKDSQDFLAGGYADAVASEARPGDIILEDGTVVGKHNGIWHYTIGQRRGLGVSYKYPLYVIGIDAKNNRVIAGPDSSLLQKEMEVTGLNWIYFDPEQLPSSFEADTRIRYMHKESPSRIEVISPDRVKVVFDTPQRSITPGQFAVFYRGEYVIGSGRIE